ncbi:hypothetical protein LCGC14_2250010, partial [marine sediment metagenome]
MQHSVKKLVCYGLTLAQDIGLILVAL